ncbi:MAG: hypothetical protein J6Y91_02100 [Alphaproteobacteria bacterium]|nr:hypothetical protein [Alphaproteobacteria bacterium]
MKMWLVFIACLALSFYGGCWYEKNKLQRRYAEQKLEVIAHASKKRAQIQAQPNATRDELLRLMRAGEL